MKIRFLLATLLCALAYVPAINAEDAKEPETPLQVQMNKMNEAFKKLRGGAVADASKNAASLAAIADFRAAAQEAAKLQPNDKRLKAVPAADQPKFIAGYQAQMKDLMAEVDKLEAALKANNNTDAAAIFGKIGQIQKAGHDEYKKVPKKN